MPSGCNSWPARQSAVCVCCTDGISGPTCATAIYGGHTAPRLCFLAVPVPRLGRIGAGLGCIRAVPQPRSCRVREGPGTCSGDLHPVFRICSDPSRRQLQVIRPPAADKVRRDESNPGRPGREGPDMAARAAARSGCGPESHRAGLGWPSYLGGGPRLAAHQRKVATAPEPAGSCCCTLGPVLRMLHGMALLLAATAA